MENKFIVVNPTIETCVAEYGWNNFFPMQWIAWAQGFKEQDLRLHWLPEEPPADIKISLEN
jgi:hypothetical protein